MRRAPQKQYELFRKYFPFSCVDIVLLRDDSVLLTKRAIPPYRGKWHLPGGIIRRNETMRKAVKRIGRKELQVDVKIIRFIGSFENPNRYRHDISHCFLCATRTGLIKLDSESSRAKFFQKIPKNTIPFHKNIINQLEKRSQFSKKYIT